VIRRTLTSLPGGIIQNIVLAIIDISRAAATRLSGAPRSGAVKTGMHVGGENVPTAMASAHLAFIKSKMRGGLEA